MDKLDKNIKKVFSTYVTKQETDLEESILERLTVERDYTVELLQSRRKIKIGMIISVILLVAYFVLTYLNILSKANYQMGILDIYSSSTFTALMIFVTYLMSIFSFRAIQSKTIIPSGA